MSQFEVRYLNDPPWYSSGLSLFFLALSANSLTVVEIDWRPRDSAPLTMGVINPLGVATATEMSMFLSCLTLSPEANWTLDSGTSRKANEAALIKKSLTETLTWSSSEKLGFNIPVGLKRNSVDGVRKNNNHDENRSHQVETYHTQEKQRDLPAKR